MEYFTNDSLETKKMGERLAEKILKTERWSDKFTARDLAFVLGLEGELGGGKTTFLQGFAKGLGIKEKILSPTFVIMKRFEIENCKLKIENFYHVDCYRIEDPQEILNLGLKDIISNSKNIVAIEWVDKIKEILPESVMTIKFEFLSEKKRKITLRDKI